MATTRTKPTRKAAKAGQIPNVGRDYARTLQLVSGAKAWRPPATHPHRGSRLPYNVVGGSSGASRPDLTEQELIDLQKALGATPGDALRRAYWFALASYTEYSRNNSKATPGKVLDRIGAVLTHGQDLQEALQYLEITDEGYIGSFWTTKHLANRPCVSQMEFLRALVMFLADVGDAVKELKVTQRKGKMPAYPAHALALTIAQALFLENKEFPSQTSGDVFDRVLKCALAACDARMGIVREKGPRKDLKELMQIARDNFEIAEALKFGDVLTTSPPNRSLPAPRHSAGLVFPATPPKPGRGVNDAKDPCISPITNHDSMRTLLRVCSTRIGRGKGR